MGKYLDLLKSFYQEYPDGTVQNFATWLDNLEAQDRCELQGCTSRAEYEGWYRVKDFAGLSTGVIQKRRVCKEHTSLLIGKFIEES